MQSFIKVKFQQLLLSGDRALPILDRLQNLEALPDTIWVQSTAYYRPTIVSRLYFAIKVTLYAH